MRLEKIIARGRIVELGSPGIASALEELLEVSISRFPNLSRDALLDGLLRRENTMTTYLGHGVALPHVRAKLGGNRRYILAAGRSRAGIPRDGAKAGEKTHLFLMLIADERARDYLQVLGAIAHLADDAEFVKTILSAPTLDDMHACLLQAFGGGPRLAPSRERRMNRLMAAHAELIAKGAGCDWVMVYGDTFAGGTEPHHWPGKTKAILVTRTLGDTAHLQGRFSSIIQVRSFSRQRLAQLRSALIVGLTRGVISPQSRVCCLAGITGSNQFDTIVVVDVGGEFQALLEHHAEVLPADVKPEVFERMVGIASELGVEGREGKPVGSLFVIGDTARVEKFVKPLILNPFFGYKEEDRNVLNPFMDETVKEFSSLDGAFVIRGDGVVVSAGSLVQAADYGRVLPGGLGSRHAAAAAISAAADCIAIAVSASSGQVTLFRRGAMLPLMDRSKLSKV